MEAERRKAQALKYKHDEASALGQRPAQAPAGAPGEADQAPPQAAGPFVRTGRKVGRNEPCPCGSGKKYKQCCGKLS